MGGHEQLPRSAAPSAHGHPRKAPTTATPADPSRKRVIDLQRTLGNAATARLLAARGRRTVARAPVAHEGGSHDPDYPGLTLARANLPPAWAALAEARGFDFRAYRIVSANEPQPLVVYDREEVRYFTIEGIDPPAGAADLELDALLTELNALQTNLRAYTSHDSYHTGTREVTAWIATHELVGKLSEYEQKIGGVSELEWTLSVMADPGAIERVPEGRREAIGKHQTRVEELMQGMSRGAVLEPVALEGGRVANGYHRILAADRLGLLQIPVFQR